MNSTPCFWETPARQIFRTAGALAAGLAVWAGAFSTAPAASRTITSVTPEGNPYVIDWDAGNPARDYNFITGTAGVTCTGELPAATLRLYLWLIDDEGRDVALTGTRNTASWNVPALAQGQTASHVFTFAIDPDEPLSPDRRYRVRAEIQRQAIFGGITQWLRQLGSEIDSGEQTYYHFTNTFNTDAAWNALAHIESVSIARDWRVQSSTSNVYQQFRIVTNTRFLRFDEPGAATPASHNIGFQFRMRLTDDLGMSQTLTVPAATGHSRTESLATWQGAREPVDILRSNLYYYFKPQSQLNPVNRLYSLALEVWSEPAPGQPPVLLSQRATVPMRLLDFNGTLRFGSSFNTTMRAATRTATLYLPTPLLNPSYLAVEMNLADIAVSADGATYSGNPGAQPLRLWPSGLATYAGTATLTLDNGGTNRPSRISSQGISYLLGTNVTVNSSGASGMLIMDPLPAGMGVTYADTPPTGVGFEPYYSGALYSYLPPVSGVTLTSSLAPAQPVTWNYPGGVWVMEESKPVAVRATALTWVPGDGRFDLTADGQVHHPEAELRQKLATAPTAIPAEFRERRSNNDAWLLATSVVTGPTQPQIRGNSTRSPAPGSDASATMDFLLGAGTFKSHFPEADITTTSGIGNRIRVQEGLLAAASSFLDGVSVVTQYLRTDPENPAAVSYNSVNFQPTANGQRMYFTATGGLRAAGTVTSGGQLRWGWLPDSRFAFRTDAFSQAAFYMPGTFYPQVPLASGHIDLAQHLTPVNLHLAGQVGNHVWDFNHMERPGTNPYRQNSLLADYAGVNLRVAAQATGIQAQSVISNATTPAFPLKTHCRYYVRRSGVTGIHDALGGPTGVSLFGFDTALSSYGFSFRDSRITHSVTAGELVVPYPSEFVLPVEDLVFSTDGTPSNARPTSAGGLMMAYWQCDLTPLGLEFKRTNPANAAQGVMVIESAVKLPSLGDGTILYGSLGFHSHGGLVRPADNLHGIASRLRAPNQIVFNGPAKPGGYEKYRLTPVCDVYLNHHEGGAAGEGFLNLAGMLDVAFFRDIQVHLQASSNSSTSAEVAVLHLTGGWTTGTDPSKNSFFNNPDFDPANLGRPSGVPLANYRNGADYRPRAKRTWMDAVNFDYPLVWDNTTRMFTTPEDYNKKVDLMVLSAYHQLESLSAELASLRFGVQYDGIPEISVGNMLVNAVDDVTGALSAIESALAGGLQATAGAALWGASDAAAGLFNDSLDVLLGPVIEDALQGAIQSVVIDPLAGSGGALLPEDKWSFIPLTDPHNGWVRRELTKLGSLPGNDNARINSEVQDSIQKIIDGIDVFIGEDGLLETDSNGNFTTGAKLVFALIDKVASAEIKSLLGIRPGGSAEAALAQQTTRMLDKYAPALRTATTRLEAIRARLVEVQSQFDVNGMLAGVIEERFDALQMDWDTGAKLGLVLADDLKQHLRTRYAGNPQAFAIDENRVETARFLIRRIRDRIATAAIAGHLQTVFRQQLQDLQTAIDQTVGSVFAGFKRTIRDMVVEMTSGLDDSFSSFAGEFNGTVQHASIAGHAVIRGDTLNHLRLDATISLTLDEPVVFKGYLQISQLQANTGYGNAREIRIGAEDVPIEIMDSSANFDVELRIVLDAVDHTPMGLGGKIEMVSGRLSFESFIITDFGAAVMFGSGENFLAAKLGLEFSSFRVMGALFIGHSSSLEPLRMVDPDVASMLNEGPITGIYVYGEVFMPIVDLGCFFRVSAGLGLGAFYFVEGPTYGGKIKAAVDGQALCVVTVGGEVVLIGVKTDIIRFKGKGKVKGAVGWCPFCVKFSKQIEFTYDKNNGFDAKF